MTNRKDERIPIHAEINESLSLRSISVLRLLIIPDWLLRVICMATATG